MSEVNAPTDLLDELSREVYERAHEELQESIARAITLHLTAPWIPDFKTILISPLQDGLESLLGPEIFQWEERRWYYPSFEWFRTHVRISHAEKGTGCDLEQHISFLTEPNGEFAVACVLKDNSAFIFEADDFQAECNFWKDYGPRNF